MASMSEEAMKALDSVSVPVGVDFCVARRADGTVKVGWRFGCFGQYQWEETLSAAFAHASYDANLRSMGSVVRDFTAAQKSFDDIIDKLTSASSYDGDWSADVRDLLNVFLEFRDGEARWLWTIPQNLTEMSEE